MASCLVACSDYIIQVVGARILARSRFARRAITFGTRCRTGRFLMFNHKSVGAVGVLIACCVGMLGCGSQNPHSRLPVSGTVSLTVRRWIRASFPLSHSQGRRRLLMRRPPSRAGNTSYQRKPA